MISRVMDRESWALIVFQNEVTASSRQFFSHIESLLNLSFFRDYCCYYAVYGEILINEDLFRFMANKIQDPIYSLNQ